MAGTTGEYIKHHLTNLTYGQHADGTWGFAHDAAEAKAMGFWSINVDSMAWSIGLGLVFFYFFRKLQKMSPVVYQAACRILLNGYLISLMTMFAVHSMPRTILLRHSP